ncbi:MAG: ATP-binding protein [Desulfuromonadales bacterium]|jgi:two-component system, OmpR family, phosphate regulon sensor histidine kinase PhoR
MRRRRLIWQIYPPFLLIILIALLIVTWVFSHTLNNFYSQETRADLEARVRLVLPQVQGVMALPQQAYLDALSKQLGAQAETRLTIILPNGHVVGDSEEMPARMDNHADRPEVIDALRGELGVATRFSHTLQQNMMYVALPVVEEDTIVGCVRAALPMRDLASTLQSAFYPVIKSGLAIAVIAALISLWLSRRISRPLEEMKRGAERFACGELEGRLPTYRGEEMGGLAEAMNQMAAQLDDRIRTVVRQRNEQEAVLASMIEGVLAIDNKERILRINQSAADLLNIDPQLAVGRRIQEVVRKPELQNFIARALASQQQIEADIALVIRDKQLHLQAHGTPLCDSSGTDIGALVVLNDMTRLQRLENIRRDFVANVSHELKTPITAIKGSVETLINGAVDDQESAQRFLQIIARQSDRLNAIIEDLLALSRIEQGQEDNGIALHKTQLRSVLVNTLQACQINAQDKQITLAMDCPETIEARINAPLLEQALVNLVDNAIKYSPEKGRVTFSATVEEDAVIIEVRDWGSGIPQEHLPRLFERFYRVDKARSRKLGGTGLGLAIVKHIVHAHNGEIRVESTLGQGSTFTIYLPLL